jgi:hypothetical protein
MPYQANAVLPSGKTTFSRAPQDPCCAVLAKAPGRDGKPMRLGGRCVFVDIFLLRIVDPDEGFE